MSEKLKIIADFDAEVDAWIATQQPVVSFPIFERDDMDAIDYVDYIRSFETYVEPIAHAHAA